jgi:hypothetical protein
MGSVERTVYRLGVDVGKSQTFSSHAYVQDAISDEKQAVQTPTRLSYA